MELNAHPAFLAAAMPLMLFGLGGASYRQRAVCRFRPHFFFWWFVLPFFLIASWSHAAPALPLEQIYKENAPAVVLIRMVDAAGKTLSIGTGFVVASSGVIVTNHHVIKPKPGARLVVKLPNGDTYDDVWVIHDEERRDLAVLLIKAVGLPAVKLGDSDKVEVGGQVVALGHPQGLEMTFTAGIVSAIRPMPGKGYRFIQHQTPISPGSSGGPLLNVKGEVVGINTFGFEGGQNLNGAVPVNYVKAYLQEPPKMTYEQYARARGVLPAETERTWSDKQYGVSFKYPADWGFLEWTGLDRGALTRTLLFAKLGRLPFIETRSEFEPKSEVMFAVKRRNVESFVIHARGGDLVKLAKEFYESSATNMLIGAMLERKFLQDHGYAGFYQVYTMKGGSEQLWFEGKIFAQSYEYVLEGHCWRPALHSYCVRTFKEILASFTFPK